MAAIFAQEHLHIAQQQRRQGDFMPRRIGLCFSLRFFAAGVFCVAAYGQTFYGSIVGSVTDSSAAPVANAAVTVTNLGTTERRSITTETTGLYRFVNRV